jgi:energy-coupling factor transporter ATP-binding protein EcfA2
MRSREAASGPFDRLILRNVRCFREAVVELDPRLTVLIGENGSGKTTLVEALASLSHGEDEGLAEFPLTRRRSGSASCAFGSRGFPGSGFEGVLQDFPDFGRSSVTTQTGEIPKGYSKHGVHESKLCSV